MGVGKSFQVLALILTHKIGAPTLVVAPKNLLSMWKNEIFGSCVEPPLDLAVYYAGEKGKYTVQKLREKTVVLTTYETVTNQWRLRQRWIADSKLRAQGSTHRTIKEGGKSQHVQLMAAHPSVPLLAIHWGRVVGDEIHTIRNTDTAKSRAMVSLMAQYRIGCTGTMFFNEYTDIRTIFEFIKLLPFDDLTLFKKYFILKPKNSVLHTSAQVLAGTRNAILAQLINGASVRRLGEEKFEGDVISVPQAYKIHDKKHALSQITIDIEGQQKSENDLQWKTRYYWHREWMAVKARMKRNGLGRPKDDLHKYEVLPEIIKAVQAAKHPLLPTAGYGGPQRSDIVPEDLDDEWGLREAAYTESNTTDQNVRSAFRAAMQSKWKSTRMLLAVKVIVAHLEKSVGKILVFDPSISALDVLQIGLNEEKIASLGYNGEMSDDEKKSSIDAFTNQDGPRVLLATPGSAGLGLNLTVADGVVLLSPLWSDSLAKQCVKRAHRMGQLHQVHVYTLSARRSIEYRVAAIQKRKLQKGEALIRPKNNTEKRIWGQMESWSLDEFEKQVSGAFDCCSCQY